MSFSIFDEVIIDASRNIANVGIITAQEFKKADGTSIGGLTVKNLEGIGGGPKVPEVVNVNTITFDANSGFNITDEGNGEVFVDLGSTFNPWYVDGQPTLKADGEEPLKIVAGNGISITTVPVIAGLNTCKAIELSIGNLPALTVEATERANADAAEATARTNADDALSGRLDTLEADPTTGAALTAEATARANADARLLPLTGGTVTGNITASAVPTDDGHLVNKLYADQLIGQVDLTQVETNRVNIAAEITARTNADTAFSGRLNALEADPTTATALSAETTARTNADALKYDKTGGNISGGVTIATDKIVLSASGDASFAGNISVNTTATADIHLANKKYVDDTIAAVVDNAPAALNTLSEIANAMSDGNDISTSLVNQISNEVTERTNADTSLSGRLDTLEADPTTATALTTAIDAEVTARDAAILVAKNAAIAAIPADFLPNDDISGGYIISNPKVLTASVSIPTGNNCAVYGPEVTVGDSTVITIEDDATLLVN